MPKIHLSPLGILLVIVAFGGCHDGASRPPDPPRDDRARERERMVATQLEARDISDPRVLAAMRAVPRHRFVPEAHQAAAYEDRPLPIGFRQTISQPYIVAFMTQVLQLEPEAKVLDIGTGSGYQAAVLAELGCRVYSVEIVEGLGLPAARTLAELGYDVQVRIGDGYGGWPDAAPFDAILVAAAPDHVPQALIDQLALGGRLVLPVGGRRQELLLLRKTPDGVVRESLIGVRFVPMTGEAQRR